MWTLTVRHPGNKPQEYILKEGRNTIGRHAENDIVVFDVSASRMHAEIVFDKARKTATLQDFDSTNGTFLNRDRLKKKAIIRENDIIRIGAHTITVSRQDQKKKSTTRRFTRELVLESLDNHAVLMYEIAFQLNNVLDTNSAITKVSALMRESMGAEVGEVILAEDFHRLSDLGFPTQIAKSNIENQIATMIPDLSSDSKWADSDSAAVLNISSAMCIPVVSGEQTIALIYLYKTDSRSRPFNDNDLRLAIAISHQTSLTIQRMQILEKYHQELQGRHILQRFLSPQEVEFVLREYIAEGSLPGLMEQNLTIMFADIIDSSGLAEKLGAKEFGEILNKYYQDTTDIVFKNYGLIKYQGDGVMAVFGVGESFDFPEDRAVISSIEILEKIKAYPLYGDQKIEIGIGINSGQVAAGYVGTQQRTEFNVLGDSVNVAFGLSTIARPDRIVVGQRTAASLGDKYNLSSLGDLKLKGKEKSITMFEVIF